MQFSTGSGLSRRFFLNTLRSVNQRKSNELNLSLYSSTPTEDISLIEFHEIAIRRLKVLKVVDDARERYAKNSDDYKNALYTGLSKLMPLACGVCSLENISQERRWDNISHFILCLAFCRTPEQKKWFMQNETDLFAFRFQREMKDRHMIAQFLAENKLNDEVLTAEEKDDLCRHLSSASEMSVQKARCIQFYRVPFEDALELVRKRKVYLQNGFALVAESDFVVIVCSRFRTIMSAAMARACKYIDCLGEEERIIPFLRKLANNSYLGKGYTGKGKDVNRITPDMIDKLALESFPLCMRSIHQRLKLEHHLRHGARMQYGLFLKGIGLSMEDALTFWRSEFTKRMDGEKFDKQYAYNIRHNYGKEGRRVEYSAYSCQKIILGNAPTPVDCHGCPYRHYDSEMLVQKLENAGITKNCIEKINDLCKAARYDKACTAYFESVHKIPENSLGTVITHPNEYFELSVEIHKGTKKIIESSQSVLLTPTQDEFKLVEK